MIRINRGTPIRTVRVHHPNGATWVTVEHEGEDGHDKLEAGEQCECGQLPTGIIAAVYDGDEIVYDWTLDATTSDPIWTDPTIPEIDGSDWK